MPGYSARPIVFVACSTKGVHTAHALSVCSFLRSWSAYEIVQIRPCRTVPSVLFFVGVSFFFIIFSRSKKFKKVLKKPFRNRGWDFRFQLLFLSFSSTLTIQIFEHNRCFVLLRFRKFFFFFQKISIETKVSQVCCKSLKRLIRFEKVSQSENPAEISVFSFEF